MHEMFWDALREGGIVVHPVLGRGTITKQEVKPIKRDDYVALYIVRDFEMQKNSYSPEIAEKRWFPLSELPPDITPSTLKRIEEFLDQREKSDKW